MDYKEKYEQALERAKFLKENSDGVGAKDVSRCFEEIFPELKESEDERIRKALIELVKMVDKNPIGQIVGYRDIKYSDMIAWLEKQGKKSNIPQNPEDDLRRQSTIRILEYARSLDAYNQYGKESINKDIAWLEKQGGDEHSDKVELKFKVGDWIINSEGTLRYIVAVDRTGYATDNGWLTHDIYDNTYHLWTIKDAKKGDILQANRCTLIFDSLTKDIDGNTVISSWYSCDTHTFYGMGTSQPDLWVTEGVVPATKEQCNFLFQKMKEAGYEWDVEKKELRKIEQKHTCKLDNSYAVIKFPFKAKVKSTDKIVTIHDGQLSPDGKEWIKYQSDFEDGYKTYEPNDLELVCKIGQKSTELPKGEDYGIDSLWHAIQILEKTLGDVEGYQSDDGILEHKCAIEAVKHLYEQKSAWSEEDEIISNEIQCLIGNYRTGDDEHKLCSWIDNLKERVQPQPKQEWGEEDEKILCKCLDAASGYYSPEDKQSMKDWLKSIKERMKGE